MGEAAHDRRIGERGVEVTTCHSGMRAALYGFPGMTRYLPNRLCRCTINAMANSGVARLTIGIDTKAAMNRPPI